MSQIQLVGGRYFDFTEPGFVVPSITEIAHALSHICRFTGHVREFYSVAEHSVHVSRIVPPHLALSGLLHDAAEAVLGDVAAPLKAMLPDYKQIEAHVESVIFERYGVTKDPAIKNADLVMLATERRDLMPNCHRQWEVLQGVRPLTKRISSPMGSSEAKLAFLLRYRELTSQAAPTA